MDVMIFLLTNSIALREEEFVISLEYFESMESTAAAKTEVPVFAVSEELMCIPIFGSTMMSSGKRAWLA